MKMKGNLKLEHIEELKDGSAIYNFIYDGEFRTWFLKDQGLKRMSYVRLRKLILEALKSALDKKGIKV